MRLSTKTTLIALALPLLAHGQSAEVGRKIYDKATPSLVAVSYSIVGEVDTANLVLPGVVVRDDGLILIPGVGVNEAIPDVQLKKFKIIIPRTDGDNDEIDAEFQGRDPRTNYALIKAVAGKEKRDWTPIKFEAAAPKIGETVYSVGLLHKSAGYHPFLTQSTVAAHLRGAIKQVMVSSGGLATPGSPVFNGDGVAIGLVAEEAPAEPWLDEIGGGQQAGVARLLSGLATNHLFIPTPEFSVSITDPPTPGHDIPIPFIGITQMSGLTKEDAELHGLKNQPAVQIGDLLPDSAAEKAGLEKRDVIVKFNGQPLERGDVPEELPGILTHQMLQMKLGQTVTFSILRAKDQPLKDVTVTLGDAPMRANKAKRYWSDDVGFGVREPVLGDRYGLHLDTKATDGVIVTTMKRDGSAASAGLRPNDMVLKLNGVAVAGLDPFKSAYEDFRAKQPHQAIVMVVKRGGSDETIRIEPPQ